MRGDFLVMDWHPQDDASVRTAQRIEARLLRDPRIAIVRANGLMIATEDVRVEQVAPSLFLLGDVFGRTPGTAWPKPKSADERGFHHFCDRLLSFHWGSYLALRHDPHAPIPLSAFAEPIGSRECVYWRHKGVRLLGCDADRWLDAFPPPQLGPNLNEVAHIIHHPGQAAETSPLDGVASLLPGAMTYFTPSGVSNRRLWVPRDHCGRGDASDDPAALAKIVDASVRAWSSHHRKPIVELSGGFDSAVVAAGLSHAGRDGIEAFSFFSDSLAGDERRFSRAIAERLHLMPHEIAFETSAMDVSLLDSAAVGIRPGIGSTTFFHDLQLANAGRALGADALFTGRGGDALFFQHPTPLVARDVWHGEKQSRRDRLEALARWCQSSIWKVAMTAYLPYLSTPARIGLRSRFGLQAGPARHSTWAGPLDGLSPGKRMQIEAIAGDRSAFGPSRCAQAMRIIHPLLSQPIVEHMLGLSLMTLTQGRRDRAFARAAYADRLPAALIERRGKGALSYFFGQQLARSAPVLRAWLLDGALAEARLIDRHRLEQALDPEYLLQVNCYGEIIRLLIVERWLRGWAQRLQRGPEEAVVQDGDFPAGTRSPEHRNPADLPGCR